jgi:hypothetical protein
MDRDHSSLIIILLGGILFVLGGILFVLLVGRDVAIPVIGGALGVALVVGTLALFIGYIRRKRGRVSRGCFTSFYGPPTLEFLRFLALLPSILPTMPAAALMSALGEFRFIGSRPRLCS